MDLIDYSVYYSNDSFSLAERNSSIRSIPTIPLISHDIAMYEYTAIESEDGLAWTLRQNCIRLPDDLEAPRLPDSY